MAILWKTKQALLSCVAKGSLAHKASLLTHVGVCIPPEIAVGFGTFEIGDFSLWTGTTGDVTISTEKKHHGNRSAKSYHKYTAFFFKTIDATSELWTRQYVFLTAESLPNIGALRFVIHRTTSPAASIYEVGIAKSAGRYYWWHRYIHDNSTTGAFLLRIYPATDLDQWYCLETHLIVSGSAGVVATYLNETFLGGATSKDNNRFGDTFDLIVMGLWGTDAQATEKTVYTDCCEIGSTRIGCE